MGVAKRRPGDLKGLQKRLNSQNFCLYYINWQGKICSFSFVYPTHNWGARWDEPFVQREGHHREVSIKFDIRSVGIFDVVSARLGDGEVFDSAKLKNTVRFLIENDMRNVVIDLGNLEYLYSDTINAFIASNRHMLEVSGRIAILTEHPKVQDILKRAGLDNIMRIYRSEAEMIADSKEILRQTSSYRIEELQKISSQPTVSEQPPAQRTEFDDFKMEMGQRLGTKLDNNEVPQYQLGVNQAAAPAPVGFGTPPPARDNGTAYPTFNQPAFGGPTNGAQEAAPPQGQPAYGGQQAAPAFGGYGSAPVFGGPANGAPAFGAPVQGYGSTPPPSTPSNFDFPTVQLPVGSFGGSSPSMTPPHNPTVPSFPPQDLDSDNMDPRSRKPSQERMRSPNARRQQGRRVGGREFPGGMEEDQQEAAYVEAPLQEAKIPSEPYGSYTVPPVAPTSLVEEGRSPAKLFVMLLVLLLIGGLVYWVMTKKDSEVVADTIDAAPEPAPAIELLPTPAADPSAIATPTPGEVAPVPPTPAPAVEPPKPAAVEKPKPETPKPPERVASVERPKPAPSVAKKPKPAVERPKPAPEPEDNPAPAAVPQGKLRVTSSPSGAEVLVNFSKKGVTPVDIALLNNSNKIIIRLPGHKRFETTVPKNHSERELDVTLEREGGDEPAPRTPEPEAVKPKPPTKPAPVEPDEPEDPDPEELPMAKTPPKPEYIPPKPPKPAPEPAPSRPIGDGALGVIFLSSSPARADIIIDGKNSGKKTPAKLELPSGFHKIEMIKSGQKATIEQNVNEGKNKALHLTLQ